MTFDVSPKTYADFLIKEAAHDCDFKKPRQGLTIGGRVMWQFVPTSIGVFVKALCSCGEELANNLDELTEEY